MSKRMKSTGSGPSSSGIPRKFIGPEHAERYESLLSRTIQLERIVRFAPTGICGRIAEIIEQRKWQKVCEPETNINVDIVREFYANALPTREGVAFPYKTMVRGKIVHFSRNAINRFLGEPLTLNSGEECEYETRTKANTWDLEEVNAFLCMEGKKFQVNEQGHPKHWKREDFKFPVRALLVVFLNNIRPKSHVTTVPMDIGCLLYAIMTDTTVDVASIISEELRRIAISGTKFGGKAGMLFYPGLITGLCMKSHVPIPAEIHLTITSVVNDNFISRFVQGPMERVDGAAPSSARPRARRPQGVDQGFDQMAFATFCCDNFEASRRSQEFLFDSMHQQYQNSFLAPEARSFPTRAEYDAFSNWPVDRPTFLGGAGGSGEGDEDIEDVIGDVGGGEENDE